MVGVGILAVLLFIGFLYCVKNYVLANKANDRIFKQAMQSNQKRKTRLPSITEDDRFCIGMEEGFDPKITTFSLDPTAFPAQMTANLGKPT